MLTQISNPRGQATTAALVILPVAFAVFTAALILAYALSLEAKVTAACRTSVLKSQTEASEALTNLLKLNTIAESMESARKIAQAALKAAQASRAPQAIIAARAALAAAEAVQVPVMIQQKYHLFQGKRASYMAPARAIEAVRDLIPTAILERAGMSFPRTTVPRFQVIASPKQARTPTYRTAPLFEKTQTARVQWLLALNTPGSQEFAPEFVPEIDVGCEMTLQRRRDDTWVPQMTGDKLLLN